MYNEFKKVKQMVWFGSRNLITKNVVTRTENIIWYTRQYLSYRSEFRAALHTIYSAINDSSYQNTYLKNFKQMNFTIHGHLASSSTENYFLAGRTSIRTS